MRSAEKTGLLVLLRRLSAEGERPYPAEDEAREIEEQARCAALREAAAMVEAWLRDPQEPGEALLARVRELARVASEEQRADPADPEREGRRRGWWRATFVLAEALGLDAFGRRPTALPVASGDWPERLAREPRPYTGPTCAGVRKDGEPCGGKPLRNSDLCRHHQGQEAVRAAAGPQDPEAALDRQVEAWLADFERGQRAAREGD
jgi:hypothetical protein